MKRDNPVIGQTPDGKVLLARAIKNKKVSEKDSIKAAKLGCSHQFMKPIDYDNYYRALKAYNFAIYLKAIQYAGGVSLNHRLNDKVAASVEAAMVVFACELLKVKPEK